MELDLRSVRRTSIGGYAISRVVCVPTDEPPSHAGNINASFNGITVSFDQGSFPVTEISYMNPETGEWERAERVEGVP